MDAESLDFEEFFKIIFLLKRSLMRVHGEGERNGLARLQLGALGILSANESQGLTDLSGKLRISKPQATILVRRLEELGLVKRSVDKDDARAASLRISAKGRKALAENVEAIQREVGRKMSGLSQEDRAELKSSMESMVRILEKMES
jgi:DNA-binding MarR family transcriptional regulator